jgi:hypothetical protein
MRWLPFALALLLAPAVYAAPEHDHDASRVERAKKPFGPWDAGPRRGVKRQGKTGKDRNQHPFVGEAAKVPASGPPPPPLRRDPDMPELTRPANKRASGLSANPLYLAALTYANFITKIDGPRCQHYPTCSRFANQAVQRHGVLGIVMGLDRLIQDGNSSALRALPQLEMPGGTARHFDPVDNYEFWKEDARRAFPPPTEEKPLVLEPLPTDRRATKKAFTGCRTDRTIPAPSHAEVEEDDGCVPPGS